MTKTIEVDQRILPLIIRRTSRKRSIGVELTCRQEVIVRAPRALGEAAIAEGVSKCLPWLRRKLALWPDTAVAQDLAPGSEVLFLGEAKRLAVACGGERGRPQVALCGQEMQVALPSTYPTGEATLLRDALVAWYRSQAAVVIGELVARYSAIVGVPPPLFSISHARRRWGSCGANGRLNFAWRLVMAPFASIEYVVVHELCHLKQRDHSPAFWALVAAVLPDYRERRLRLRREGVRYDL